MSEVRLLGRVALGLALLALLAAAIALHGLRAQRLAGRARLGMTLAAAAPVVTSLRGGGIADRAGLRVGDVVEAVGGRAPGSLADIERAVAKAGRTDLRVRRGTRDVTIVIG